MTNEMLFTTPHPRTTQSVMNSKYVIVVPDEVKYVRNSVPRYLNIYCHSQNVHSAD